MKLNISNPKTGKQKSIEIENDIKFLHGKTIGSEIKGKVLCKELNDCILKINGGQDKQGFPMKPGILTNRRVKLLLSKGTVGCKGNSFKKGERRKKSVRGCIFSSEIGTLNLSIVKKTKLSGIINNFQEKFSKLKRASKIRKLFSLSKGDNLKKHIILKIKNTKLGMEKTPYVKIQRIITPVQIQRKRLGILKKNNSLLKTKSQLTQYAKFLNV